MTAPQLQAKFVRAFFVPPTVSNGTDGSASFIMRLLLEFWGFCVYGSNDLINPGVGSVPAAGYTNMAATWFTGSNVLLASGSDGVTVQGLPYFNVTGSTPFPPTVQGKWLTMWQSGSTSTDDSIYYITQWLNSSSIAVDPTYGGTPVGPTGSVPQLTSRSGINYRVIDYAQAVAVGAPYATGKYIVLQFPLAAQINPGQLQSQWQFIGHSANSNISQLSVVLSPSGSWNGSSFSDASATISPEGNIGGPGTGGWGTPDWFHNSGGGRGFVTIIGGMGFVICQAGSDSNGFMPNGGSCIQVEIPIRLYPQANDPNPICAMNFGNDGIGVGSQVGYGFGHRFFPSPYDGLTRRWAIMTKNPMGSYWASQFWNGNNIQGGFISRWEFFYNQSLSKFWMGDGVLCMPTINGQTSATGQFSLCRARARTMRFTAGGYPYYLRVGDDHDKWIHAGGGVLWPWDHSIVTGRPLFAGF